ncbi:MAG: hypothetical protein Q9167_003994 [Letrouitia subvulpina]
MDKSEQTPETLRSRRRDQNPERMDKLKQLNNALAEYVRDESRYLDHMDGLDENHDLFSLYALSEPSIHAIEKQIENILRALYKLLHKRPKTRITNDEMYFHIKEKSLERGARALIATLAIVLLLTPVVILYVVQKTALRFTIILIASAAFVLAVAIMSKAKAVEIFVAGATYTAVLVVFIAGNGISVGN